MGWTRGGSIGWTDVESTCDDVIVANSGSNHSVTEMSGRTK